MRHLAVKERRLEARLVTFVRLQMRPQLQFLNLKEASDQVPLHRILDLYVNIAIYRQLRRPIDFDEPGFQILVKQNVEAIELVTMLDNMIAS